MADQETILKIVAVSPNDVKPERDALRRIVEQVNRDTARQLGARLELRTWEEDARPGFNAGGPQAVIDPALAISECGLLTGIFWRRFGTLGSDGKTGTEHEFELAVSAWKQNQRPEIMIYFNEKPYYPKTSNEIAQSNQVFQFRERFPQEGLWWCYKGKAQFAQLVSEHLRRWVHERMATPYRRQTLRIEHEDFHQLQAARPFMIVDPPTCDAFIDETVEKPEFCEILKKLGRVMGRTFIEYVAENRLTEAGAYLQRCALNKQQRDRLIEVAQQSFKYLREISHE